MKLSVASVRPLLRAFVSVSTNRHQHFAKKSRIVHHVLRCVRRVLAGAGISRSKYSHRAITNDGKFETQDLFILIPSMTSERCADMINPALEPEVVLSESNRKACIEKFKSFRVPKMCDVKEAAVLVPLCIYKEELGLLYTLRSMKLTANRGQVSFPGGMRDKSDVDLQETALRETWEELKIPKEKINVWTRGNLIGKSDVNVMPVLAYIGEVVPEKLDINPDEVEEVFVVSLQKLCDPELCSFTHFRSPPVTLPCYLGGKYRVWGFTGAITHMALESLVPQVYKHKFFQIQSAISNKKESDAFSKFDARRSKI